MAQGIQLDRSRFSCVICLDLLSNPVTLPCGHNYCMNCINDHLDQEYPTRMYSCPQCRQKFLQRPVLVKNSMLAFVVDELKKTAVCTDDSDSDHCYARPGDVACDLCTGRKMKAVKSCLQCSVSYCGEHLQPHYTTMQFRKHELVDPSTNLQENICNKHQEVMKIFCRTDQRCICYLCSKDEHKGHVKVSAAAERLGRQKDLDLIQMKIKQRLHEKEKDVKTLQQEEEAVTHSADKALKNTQQMFSELIRLIQTRESNACEKIKTRQRTEVLRFQKVQEKLEQEIDELRKKDVELQKISKIEDHTRFLLSFPNTSGFNEDSFMPSFRVRRLQYFEKVTIALVEAKEKIEEVLSKEYAKITLTVGETGISSINPNSDTNPDPKTRSDFLQYARQITLDPNTANEHLVLSKENFMVEFINDECSYAYHPERFAYSWQVLSKENVTGRCYWEVERTEKGVLVAVAYKDISRQGNFIDCVFGHNDKSWALDCFKNSYEFKHNGVKTHVPGTWCSRIGVYLDQQAGVLAFYSVSDKMTLLHRVQTSFSQPLHAGLWLSNGASAELYRLK